MTYPRIWAVGMALTLLLSLAITSMPAAAERLAPSLQEQSALPSQSDTGAEVLYVTEVVEVAEDLSWQATEYVSIRINSIEAARDYGRVNLSYNHFYSGMDLEFANVRNPEGEIKPLAQDAVQERTGGSQDFYEDRTKLAFSLPNIRPGSILEFQVRRFSKQPRMPGLFSDVYIAHWYQPTVSGDSGRLDPVHFASHDLVVPKALELFVQQTGPAKARQKE